MNIILNRVVWVNIKFFCLIFLHVAMQKPTYESSPILMSHCLASSAQKHVVSQFCSYFARLMSRIFISVSVAGKHILTIKLLEVMDCFLCVDFLSCFGMILCSRMILLSSSTTLLCC